MSKETKAHAGFTLPELLISTTIFAMMTTAVGSLYALSLSETRRGNTQSQVYEDARYLMSVIKNEITNNAIDYDEYYNQNVVIPTIRAAGLLDLPGVGQLGFPNIGQNFGRYYSSFFNPGSDSQLGFACNDGVTRNGLICTPRRKTMDRETGLNPFDGKYDTRGLAQNQIEEDAFCGILSYATFQNAPGTRMGKCLGGVPNPVAERIEDKLFLISAKGDTKTIFAREMTDPDMYALSLLKMTAYDVDLDGINDLFTCADGFECIGTEDVNGVENTPILMPNGEERPGELPRTKFSDNILTYPDLNAGDGEEDPESRGFSKDFVPMSPFILNIKSLNFLISPTEDPYYAYAETTQNQQPKVTILMTVELNPKRAGISGKFIPLTLVETVTSGITTPIPAPVKERHVFRQN
ncbi:MAG: type II secretion system protein [Patescibacteria group bacterium]